uniref:TNF receptor-associated factor n=1 Tax=Callorhinchus milii TaxID=7868 RepID=A0A4W3J001_CALMI
MKSAGLSPPSSLESQAAGNQRGFPKEILTAKVEDKYLCVECHGILRKPFQVQCGHRFCASCLKWIVSSSPQKCAACIEEDIYEDPTSILNETSAFPDNAARREVESMLAVCINQGCSWKGTVRQYETTHEGRCEFMQVHCEACRSLVRQVDLARHLERECLERSLNCKFCKSSFHYKEIKAHDEICPKFPITCEWCGKRKIPREKYTDHLRGCGKVKLPCRFCAIGCDATAEKESLMEHESQCILEHLQLMLQSVLDTKQEVRSLEPESLEKQFVTGRQKVEEILRRCGTVELKIGTFENIVCVLNREVERASVTMTAYDQQHKLDTEKIEALQAKVRQLERAAALKDLAIAELELQVQVFEYITYDGVFIWKISDFNRRRQEAMSGRAAAIFSPAFYTSKYGYKMCLRIYLNGDGVGRGSHVSLFFVVMRGNYDALLRWPFKQKVTLMLMDQNNREHVIDAFRPDVSSSSFQRPVGDMNIASGCPLFCPLTKLESKNSYTRDDTIFIKAIVDLTDL